MRIVDIREASVPIGAAMRNASVSFHGMTASAVAILTDEIIDGRPLVGYAFDSIGRYAKGGLLRERFIPRLLAAAPESLLDAQGMIDPESCWRVMMTDEKDGGHGERSGAVGMLDAALWDLRAKAHRLPLWRELARYYGKKDGAEAALIPTYASCGHFQDEGGDAALREEVARALGLGYTTVKIKVGGRSAGADGRRIEAALSAMAGAQRLAIDANGKADPSNLSWTSAICEYGLAWVEEPASPLDYETLAAFTRRVRVPIATGENLFSWDDARNLLLYGGLRPGKDRIQIDMLLAYGIPEYRRILAGFEAQGWARTAFWPHAGHLFAAHVVAGFGLGCHEAAPDAGRVYGGFWDGTVVQDGHVRLPELPGVGYEGKSNLHDVLAGLLPAAQG